MAEDRSQSNISVDCEQCHRIHRGTISVEYRARQDLGLVFAGPEEVKDPIVPWVVKFECPTTHETASATVNLPVDREKQVTQAKFVISEHGSAKLAADKKAARATPTDSSSTPAWVQDELSHLRSASLETGRTFGSTMIATSSTAVGVYFAILKYVGFGNLGGAIKTLTVLPPVLLLISAATFAAAIRPVLAAPSTLTEFEIYWRDRLATMNRLIVVGMVAFLAAIALAIPIFFGALR